MARILIVDDDPSLLCVLSNLLKNQGYTVSATLRGDRALHLLKSKESFDLLITDVRMNPVAGMELLQQSRKIRPDMPVIVITAYFSRETQKEALALGALAYLGKPWDTGLLLETVEKAVAGDDVPADA